MSAGVGAASAVDCHGIEVEGLWIEIDPLGYLHEFFSHGYGPELCQVAGMRMPRKVMLDV